MTGSHAEECRATKASVCFRSSIQDQRYIDKTFILVPLLKRSHETTFFQRPQGFGKTLTLSMIRAFVEDTGNEKENQENRSLFKDLMIMEAGDFYTRQMTSYPVIDLTFQMVKGDSFQETYDSLVGIIQDEYERHSSILEGEALSPRDRAYFERILTDVTPEGKKTPRSDYRKSLKKLSLFLRKAYGRRAVVLIDAYDVPLVQASMKGFQRQIVPFITDLLQEVLKTNTANLQFAVVTECLWITTRESTCTGLIHSEINTVLSDNLSDAFGFSSEEVEALLAEYGLAGYFSQFEQWYGGYRFGGTTIYNPEFPGTFLTIGGSWVC